MDGTEATSEMEKSSGLHEKAYSGYPARKTDKPCASHCDFGKKLPEQSFDDNFLKVRNIFPNFKPCQDWISKIGVQWRTKLVERN